MWQTKKTLGLALCAVLLLSVPAFAVVYVDDSASPGGDGNAWATAYQTIAAALLDAGAATEPINIAAGTYAETTLTLASGMKLYGGYDAATGDRDVDVNVTTVNGGGGGRIFQATGATGIVLDGLEITGGAGVRSGGIYLRQGTATIANCNVHANTAFHVASATSAGSGGGIGLDAVTSVTIDNCTVADNLCGYYGGLYATNGQGGRGGGIAFDQKTNGNAGVGGATLTVTNCTITGNSTARGSYSGGGLCCYANSAYGDTVIVSDCTFSGNIAGFQNIGGNPGQASGGAMSFENVDSATVSNCTITGNTASSGGAGIAGEWSVLTVTNCTLSGNTVVGAVETGGTAYKSDGGGAITFCALDKSHDGGGVIITPLLTVDKCRISNNVVNGGGGGTIRLVGGTYAGGSIVGTITNCTLSGNTLNSAGNAGGQNMGNVAIEIMKSGTVANSLLEVTNCTLKDNVDIGAAFSSGDGTQAAIANQASAGAIEVRNCIITGTTSPNNAIVAINTGGLTATILNNLFFGNETGGSQGTAPVLDDPDYVGSGPDPLNLQISSPAIDAGTATGVTLTEDILGGTRPVDGPDVDTDAEYDIGAYEYGATPPTPTPIPTPVPAAASPDQWMILE